MTTQRMKTVKPNGWLKMSENVDRKLQKKYIVTTSKVIFSETAVYAESPGLALMKVAKDNTLVTKNDMIGDYDFKVIGIFE